MQQLKMESDAALAERVMDAALLVTRLVRREVRRKGARGLSSSQLRTLSFLHWNEGAALAEVAEYVGLGAPAASRVVEELVQRGLVTRAPAPADRRRVELRLRRQGVRELEAALAAARAPLAVRLAGLGAEEKVRLGEAMTLLRELFSVEKPGASAAAVRHG